MSDQEAAREIREARAAGDLDTMLVIVRREVCRNEGHHVLGEWRGLPRDLAENLATVMGYSDWDAHLGVRWCAVCGFEVRRLVLSQWDPVPEDEGPGQESHVGRDMVQREPDRTLRLEWTL